MLEIRNFNDVEVAKAMVIVENEMIKNNVKIDYSKPMVDEYTCFELKGIISGVAHMNRPALKQTKTFEEFGNVLHELIVVQEKDSLFERGYNVYLEIANNIENNIMDINSILVLALYSIEHFRVFNDLL